MHGKDPTFRTVFALGKQRADEHVRAETRISGIAVMHPGFRFGKFSRVTPAAPHGRMTQVLDRLHRKSMCEGL